MKIAIFCSSKNIVPSIRTGGTEQPTYYLAKGLAEKGHDVSLFAARGSNIPGVAIREISPFQTCVKQKFLNIQERIASFYDLNALADFFKNEADDFDIIQFNSYIFYEIIPFARFSKTPIIIRVNYPHSLVYPYIKNILLEENNIYYLPISEFIKNAMPDLNYEKVIYPSIDINDFEFNERHDDYLLFLGRICYNKGAHIAVQVAKKSEKKLIIAGSPNQSDGDEYFNKFIEPYIDNEKIVYVGEVDFRKKIKLFKNAAATLFPTSWDEPFGNVQIESMACGTPVITFDRAAAREVVQDKKTGYIVRDGDVNAMTKAINNISNINRGETRRWVIDNFSNKKIISDYENLYNKILKNEK